MAPCTPTKQAHILQLCDPRFGKPKTLTEIGRIMHLDRCTMAQNLKIAQETGDFYYHTPWPGRPHLLTSRDLQHAELALARGSARDATKVQCQLFPDVSARTVRHRLCEIGLYGRVCRSKPYLSSLHIKQWKKWAEEVADWSEEDWDLVLFSDESQFNLFGSDGRQWCWRRVGEECLLRNVKKRVKHRGGSLMVWGCITPWGVGRLHRIKGNMDSKQYCSTLE